jgi:hypothetical protein
VPLPPGPRGQGRGVENRLPTLVYDTAGTGQVVWVRDGNLVHATLADPTPTLVRASSGSMAFYAARLFINEAGNLLLTWQEVVDNGPANFFAQIYDTTNDVWSEDRRLSDEVEVQHFDFDGYYDDAGVLQGTYLASSIERTEEIVNLEGTDYTFTNIPVQGITDLRFFDHSLVINLTVEDADLVVSPPWPAAGDEITAEVTVRNTGDFATTASDVSLYIGPPDDGGLLVGTERVDGPFPASAEVTLSFDFTHPSRYGNLYASVDANAEVTETDETDNTAIHPLLNTPPVAAIHATPLTGDVPLLVDFDTANSGDADGDPVTFVWSFGDGSENANGSEASHSFDAAGPRRPSHPRQPHDRP